MIEVDQAIIDKIYNTYEPLVICQVGSSMILDDANDIDLVIFYQTCEERKNKYPYRTCEFSGQTRYEIFANIIDILPETMKHYAYVGGKYFKCLAGNIDAIDRYQFDIFNNKKFREEVLILLIEQYFMLKDEHYTDTYTSKPYRFLMTCYLLNNGEYNLTDEQIEVLKKVHKEKAMSDELWEYCRRTAIGHLFGFDHVD